MEYIAFLLERTWQPATLSLVPPLSPHSSGLANIRYTHRHPPLACLCVFGALGLSRGSSTHIRTRCKGGAGVREFLKTFSLALSLSFFFPFPFCFAFIDCFKDSFIVSCFAGTKIEEQERTCSVRDHIPFSLFWLRCILPVGAFVCLFFLMDVLAPTTTSPPPCCSSCRPTPSWGWATPPDARAYVRTGCPWTAPVSRQGASRASAP